jgi:DNA mismatch endonuclease (patch repair protein)
LKIEGNRARDTRTLAALNEAGWRVLTIWECAVRGRSKLLVVDVIDGVEEWVRAGSGNAKIAGSGTI